MLLVWQPQSSPERVFSFCDVFSCLALKKLQNNRIYLPQIDVLCYVRVVHSHTQLLQTKDSAWFECAWEAGFWSPSSVSGIALGPHLGLIECLILEKAISHAVERMSEYFWQNSPLLGSYWAPPYQGKSWDLLYYLQGASKIQLTSCLKADYWSSRETLELQV